MAQFHFGQIESTFAQFTCFFNCTQRHMIELSDIRVISLFSLLICDTNVMSLFSKSHKHCIHKWTSNKAVSAGVQLNWRTEELNLDPCVAFFSTLEQLVNISLDKNGLFCVFLEVRFLKKHHECCLVLCLKLLCRFCSSSGDQRQIAKWQMFPKRFPKQSLSAMAFTNRSSRS